MSEFASKRWTYIRDGDYYEIRGAGVEGKDNGEGVDDADGVLMSAAPELYEALEALTPPDDYEHGDWYCPACRDATGCTYDGRCDRCGLPIEDVQPDMDWVENARAALKKARGEK